MPRSPIQRLYENLLQSSKIPIIESADIVSKGLYLSEDGTQNIYIKQSLSRREKLQVLLHEYAHHIHLSYHYKHESRAECELIAKGSAFLICREFGLKICKEDDLSTFSEDVDVVKRIEATMRVVASHIINELRGDNNA